VFYAIFASAEVQPWGDEPVEENQQNIVENDNGNYNKLPCTV